MSRTFRHAHRAFPMLSLVAFSLVAINGAASAAPTCPAPAETLGVFPDLPAAGKAAGLLACRIAFIESGTFTAPPGVVFGKVIVTGGGGGGSSSGGTGLADVGGGGAGGQTLADTDFSLTAGQAYTVTVGRGGAGGSRSGSGGPGSPGESSSFGTRVAVGGGGAPSYEGGQPLYTKASTGSPGDTLRDGGSLPGGLTNNGLGGGNGGGGSWGALVTFPGIPAGFGGDGVTGTTTDRFWGAAFLEPAPGKRLSYGGGGFGTGTPGNSPGAFPGSRGGTTGLDGQDGLPNSGAGGGGGGLSGSTRQAAGAGGSGFVGLDYFMKVPADGGSETASGSGSSSSSGSTVTSLKAGTPKLVAGGTEITVPVTAPSPGTAVLTGAPVAAPKRVTCRSKRSFAAAGTAEMSCVPGAGMQLLRRRKAVRVKLVVTFRPAGGGATQTVSIGTVRMSKVKVRPIAVTG